MYDKNCGEKMFGKKIYLALRENSADQAAFKGMGGKDKIYVKMGTRPTEFRRKEGTHEERNSKTT